MKTFRSFLAAPFLLIGYCCVAGLLISAFIAVLIEGRE